MKYLKAVRINNVILISVLFWGLLLNYYSSIFSFSYNHILLYLSIVFTLCSGYLINNFFDIKSDEKNLKEIKNTSAKYFKKYYLINVILSFLFLFISSLSGGWIQLIMICHFLLFIYSFKLQHWPLIGSSTVAFLCCVAISIPTYLYGQQISINNLNLDQSISSTFILFCFTLTFTREIIKDIEDIEGDRSIQSKTLPIIIGVKTSTILTVLMIVFITTFLVYGMTLSTLNLVNLSFYAPLLSVCFYLLFYMLKNYKLLSYSLISLLIKIKFFIASIWLYIHLIL